MAITGDLGGWAPGIQPIPLPEGIGRFLPRGGDIIIQMHYHPSGKAETDRTRIGLHFARKPIRQTLHWAAALNPGLKLPPGGSNIEIKAAWPVPVDLVAHAVTPHMHLLGRDIAMSITYPDGRVQDLIKIDDWDFNWQYSYFFEKPLDLPKGSVLNVVSHYDNTSANPRNPNKPPKLVKWGEATTDEMCVGFIAVTKKGQDLTRPGEKDDLMEIFQKQMEEYRARREQAIREAREKDAKVPHRRTRTVDNSVTTVDGYRLDGPSDTFPDPVHHHDDAQCSGSGAVPEAGDLPIDQRLGQLQPELVDLVNVVAALAGLRLETLVLAIEGVARPAQVLDRRDRDRAPVEHGR